MLLEQNMQLKQQKLKIVQLGVLTEAQMRAAGCTEDQIEAMQELAKTANLSLLSFMQKFLQPYIPLKS